MKTLELFSGTKSFSKVAKSRGHLVYTIDNQQELEPDLCVDIFDVADIDYNDVIWCSPPCTAFSVASIGKHWNKDHTPKTLQAKLGLELLDKTIELLTYSQGAVWFIENPRGKMRKVIDGIFKKHGIENVKRHTVTYCQ